ncbi:hypothetical protein [Microbacterium sp. B19]|uniref:hypothetical protein n=1 Tax=Microbacterium sp. B19 TaxID=96765 RepID=UPI00034BF3A5|nr:hypothetical protein [Microbacterium sp. B19]
MTEQDRTPIPDPAAQKTDRHDTSIVPDMEANPAEAEEHRLDDELDTALDSDQDPGKK